jgi:hypothetical protein
VRELSPWSCFVKRIDKNHNIKIGNKSFEKACQNLIFGNTHNKTKIACMKE